MVQDAIDEVDETFTVTISNPTNSTISIAAATITITDDDPTPSLAVNGANLTEAAANLNFTVTLSGQSSQTVTANYATLTGVQLQAMTTQVQLEQSLLLGVVSCYFCWHPS